jgi:ADP-ribosylglycohydrolase
MAGWATPLELLGDECIQRRDEGVRIPHALQAAIEALHPEQDQWNEERVGPLYDQLMELEEDAELAAREPNDLASIRALRPVGPRDLGWKPGEEDLLERVHGAWTGRAMGCALGKPVEGWGMSHREGRIDGRHRIKRYLQGRGDWPLRDFFQPGEVGDLVLHSSGSTRDRIAYMETDDDILYTLTGLGVLETHGPEFTWKHVAHHWLNTLPVTSICTAEQMAVLNLQNRTLRAWPTDPRWAATKEFTRRYRNPYREWIGAQIRADGFAWCCAGLPELAAEFAWRDASWTHERNGIYGEMFFAAVQAAAFVEHDPRRLVEIGLAEIPAECRLALAVRDCLGWVEQQSDWEACMEQVELSCARLSPTHRWHGELFPGMNPIHTINNALICVLALFYGKMDPVAAPMLAVMCGLDTDCNGATVGSIVGATTGRAAFDGTPAMRLNDSIQARMIGFQDTSMRTLAERTVVQWKRVQAYHAGRSTQSKS